MSAPVSLEIFAGFLMFALVYAPLERWLPLRRQSSRRAGWSMDVGYYALGCFVGQLSDATSIAAMLLVRNASGLDPGSIVARQPAWLQFLEILVAADFLAYWYHRSLHRFSWLWRLHRIHHSSRSMDWLANVRLHPVDKLMGDCFQFIPLFFIGLSPGPLLAYTIFLGFQGFLNHSNVRIDFGPLRWILASPQFHHWHHCRDAVAYNKNFSPHLVIFDRLFGTFYLPHGRSVPDRYGVDEPVPDTLAGQLIYPFWEPPRRRSSEPQT